MPLFDGSFEKDLSKHFKIECLAIENKKSQSLTDISSNAYLECIMTYLIEEESLKLVTKEGKNKDIMVILKFRNTD